MLWTLVALFTMLWAVGLATARTMGGLVQGFLLLAVVVALIPAFRAHPAG